MILAILFRSSLAVPGLASTIQAPLSAINNSSSTKKLSRRSVAALPSMFSPTPGTARPRKSKLNTAAGSQAQVLVTGDKDRAEDAAGVEEDTEAGDQTLANPTPEKKRRSVATPKQRVTRSAKQAAASKSTANNNGDNANPFDVIDEIV